MDATAREILDWIGSKRTHVLAQVEALPPGDLRSSRLPSGWTPLGAVRHLTLDVDRFWFRAVMAGEDVELGHGYEGWTVPADVPAEAVLDGYRDEARLAEQAVADLDLDAPPRWWPEGSAPYTTFREVLLHVLTETATHAGHLDVVRELADGGQRLVLDVPD